MLFLLFLLLLTGMFVLGYFVGPDDAPGKWLTSREKRALSVTVGLGFSIPILTQAYQWHGYSMISLIIGGVLAAVIAGRRPYLHTTLTILLALEWTFAQDFLQHRYAPMSQANPPAFAFLLAIVALLLAVPSLPLYAVWNHRQKRDAQKRLAASRASVPVTNAPLIPPVSIASPPSALQNSPPAPILTGDDKEAQILTRR